MTPRPWSPPKKRTLQSRFPKPEGLHCDNCILGPYNTGYVPAAGPASAITLIGEAPGYDEVSQGVPFIGAAGSMLTRVLKIIGHAREDYRIDNVLRCFPGETRVAAEGVERGYRRWYSGDVVTVETGEGVLTSTPNHPVLSGRGWTQMGLLVEGDNLIRGVLREPMLLGDPDVQRVPPKFEEFYDALSDQGARERMVGGYVDFHGDGGNGDVEVVKMHRMLREWRQPTVLQHLQEILLEAPNLVSHLLLGLRACRARMLQLGLGDFASPGGSLGRLDLVLALAGREGPPPQAMGFTPPSDVDTAFSELFEEPTAANPVFSHQRLQGGPTIVGASKILKVHRGRLSGHVYNLQTASQEYIANGFIVHNCCPPEMNIARFQDAIPQCRYRDATLAEGQKVVVAMGGTAIKALLGYPFKMEGFSVEDFHGTVHWSVEYQCWIVCTFHPSYLQRGATNLMGVMAFDLQRAHEVADKGWPDDPGQLWMNPSLDWFRAWADTYLAAAAQDQYAYPLSVDIETPEKGTNEGDLVGSVNDATYQITQVNLSCGPDEGITVPGDPAYLEVVRRVVAAPATKYFWYKGYDYPRLTANGCPMDPLWCLDAMWGAKALQSDIPQGLGFWAPLYSKYGAWKHLSKGPNAEPLRYAAVDAMQTRRVGDGIISDLIAQGRYHVFSEQMHRFHAIVLQPATDIGVPIDRGRLLAFKEQLDGEAGRLLSQIAEAVPASLCPLTPTAGLTKPPKEEAVHTKARATTVRGVAKKDAPDPLKMLLYARATVIEKLVLRQVLCCKTCGKTQVLKTHKCQPGLEVDGVAMLKPVADVQLLPATVLRWYWQEPFNPDSPQQMLAYAHAKGHTPGKSKQTGEPSMDRETLSKLIRETGDQVYINSLDYRAVAKVRGTYVIATDKKLDEHNRLHGTFSFKPSTMRLNGVNPNLTNVVSDKGGTQSLAAGFRKCIVAQGRWVEAGSGWEDV